MNKRGLGGSKLSSEERGDVSDKQPARAAVLHESIRVLGVGELHRSVAALGWSALAAGLSMGFSALFKAVIHAHLDDTPARFFIENLGYTVGFLIVILARQQLFTENTITAVLPVMSKPNRRFALLLLRLWAVVLAGNLVGVALFAFGLLHLPLFEPPVVDALNTLGQELMHNSPGEMFAKGIMAGWLIATMVWVIPAAPEMKFWTIALLTYLIGIGGFTHIIIGSEEALYLVFSGQLPLADCVLRMMLPVLAGNMVGGTLIFALISHAQVRSEA